MRHRLSGRGLTRTSSHNIAMRRNLAQSLFEHGQIRTTLPKAKEVRRFVERLITIAREPSLMARQRVISMLSDRAVIPAEHRDAYDGMSRAARETIRTVLPRTWFGHALVAFSVLLLLKAALLANAGWGEARWDDPHQIGRLVPFVLGFGILNDTEARAIHLGLALFLTFIAYPALRSSPRDRIPAVDWALAVAGAFAGAYLFLFYRELSLRPGQPTTLDLVTGSVGMVYSGIPHAYSTQVT